MSRLTVVLPWPDRAMHPNSRLHWAKVSPKKKKYRAVAKRETLAAMADVRVRKKAAYRVTLNFYPPNSRKRDLDGCLSAMKAGLDGIADAMGVDDSTFSLVLNMQPHDPGTGGLVVVWIE